MDWNTNRGRLALLGSEGAEVLIVFPLPDLLENAPDAESQVLREAEARLRAALLALITKSWPTEGA